MQQQKTAEQQTGSAEQLILNRQLQLEAIELKKQLTALTEDKAKLQNLVSRQTEALKFAKTKLSEVREINLNLSRNQSMDGSFSDGSSTPNRAASPIVTSQDDQQHQSLKVSSQALRQRNKSACPTVIEENTGTFAAAAVGVVAIAAASIATYKKFF